MHSEVTYTCNGPFFLGRGLLHFTTASQQPLIFIKKRKDFAISFCQSIDSFRWYSYIYFWQQYRIRHSRVTSTIMLLLQGTTACLYYASNISKKQLHCVHFREKLEQKRFSAKLRIEPGTIRLPTVGCFNHSATGLVGK